MIKNGSAHAGHVWMLVSGISLRSARPAIALTPKQRRQGEKRTGRRWAIGSRIKSRGAKRILPFTHPSREWDVPEIQIERSIVISRGQRGRNITNFPKCTYLDSIPVPSGVPGWGWPDTLIAGSVATSCVSLGRSTPTPPNVFRIRYGRLFP